MGKTSAGIAVYRRRVRGGIELLLVHPGGPFFANKDLGAWSFPKGEHGDDEDPLTVARRELEEETGLVVTGECAALGTSKQAGGKTVAIWAVEGDFDVGALRSNTFAIEWPPRSGRTVEFPEVDQAAWFTPSIAKRKLNPGQAPFVDRLCELLGVEVDG